VLTTGSCLPSLEQQPPGGAQAAAASSGKGRQAAAAAAADAGASADARGGSGGSLGSSTVLVAVLQSCQQLLPQLDAAPRQLLLSAVGRLAAAGMGGSNNNSTEGAVSVAAAGAAGSNAVRTACLQLQLQLMLRHLCEGTQNEQQQQQQQEQEQAIAAWLYAAPKLLWELGTTKPKISALLLQLLYEASRLSAPGSHIAHQLLQLQPQLAALLATPLPSPTAAAGSKGGGSKSSAAAAAAAAAQQPVGVMVGPLAGLPLSCQLLAFDTLCQQPQLVPALSKAVVLACRIAPYSDPAVQRLLDGVLAAAATGALPPQEYVSLAATLLSPGPAAGYRDRAGSSRQGGSIAAGFARHRQLADAVCGALHAYGPLQQLVAALVPPLLQQWAAMPAPARRANAGCCLTYSLASLAALALGCWAPSTHSSGGGMASQPAAPAAPAAAAPQELLAVLAEVLTAHCISRSSSSVGRDAFAAQAGLTNALQQLLLPLTAALPQQLPLALLQQLVAACLASEQQPDGDDLALAVRVVGRMLQQQGLRGVWLQQQAGVRGVLAQLEGAAQQLADRSASQQGRGIAVEVEQLKTGLALLCGR
jgi:hypothetical protein